MKKSYHGIFKNGDIVKDKEVWGDVLFVVTGFRGNEYLPLIDVHFFNRPTRLCNLPVQTTTLFNSGERPLKKVKMIVLKRMLSKGVEEAKREFIMRFTNKK